MVIIASPVKNLEKILIINRTKKNPLRNMKLSRPQGKLLCWSLEDSRLILMSNTLPLDSGSQFKVGSSERDGKMFVFLLDGQNYIR